MAGFQRGLPWGVNAPPTSSSAGRIACRFNVGGLPAGSRKVAEFVSAFIEQHKKKVSSVRSI
jgi:hypothetical protein